MDLEVIGINADNCVNSTEGRECGIEPPGSISDGVSSIYKIHCTIRDHVGR